MQETPCATIFQSAANCVHIGRCRAEYIVAINISICVSRGAKLNSVELRKLQMTGGASYTVSLPVRIEVWRLLFLPQRTKTRNGFFEPFSPSTLRDTI